MNIGEQTAREIGLEAVIRLEQAVVNQLIINKKVATRKTVRSVYGEVSTSTNRILARIYANKSLLFIVRGKRAGTKLPMFKRGGKWFLFPEIKDWKLAVGFRGPDFLLARAIARNKIDGVPIIANVIREQKPIIIQMARNKFLERVGAQYINDVRGEFRSILR
jgi:hypothetical protein